MNTPQQDLADACAELIRRKKAKEIPDRQVVRLAFLALGRLALEEGDEVATPLVKTLAAAAEPHEERWNEAVESEMTLAGAEFVQSVDPKYLDNPIYDFEYTVAARERLEARLRAADLMGLALPEGLLEQISAADERLAPYLETRRKGDQ